MKYRCQGAEGATRLRAGISGELWGFDNVLLVAGQVGFSGYISALPRLGTYTNRVSKIFFFICL